MKSFKLNLSVIVLAGITVLTAGSLNAAAPVLQAEGAHTLDAIVLKTDNVIERFAQLVVACVAKQKNGSDAIAEGKKIIADIRAAMSKIPLIHADELPKHLRDEWYHKVNDCCNQIDSVSGVLETKRSLGTMQFISALEGPTNKLKQYFQELMPILMKIKTLSSDESQLVIAKIEARISELYTKLASLGKLQAYSVIKNLQA